MPHCLTPIGWLEGQRVRQPATNVLVIRPGSPRRLSHLYRIKLLSFMNPRHRPCPGPTLARPALACPRPTLATLTLPRPRPSAPILQRTQLTLTNIGNPHRQHREALPMNIRPAGCILFG